jgi:hypothetical protein
MSFADFYNFCQTLTPKVNRNTLRDEVVRLTGGAPVKTIKTGLDITVCRGFYLSSRNENHKFVQLHGKNVIVLARDGLNHCWERFIYVKELMHLFDDNEEAADTGDKFERMLNELSNGGSETCPQLHSEFECFWKALSSFCPEDLRLEFDKERRAGRIDDYAIALQLRIPQYYVQRYFEPRYRTIIDKILTKTTP